MFIVDCNNTATSKLIYDWVSGYEVTEGAATKNDTDLTGRIEIRPVNL